MFKGTEMTDESPDEPICSRDSDSCSPRDKFGLTFNHSCWLFIKTTRHALRNALGFTAEWKQFWEEEEEEEEKTVYYVQAMKDLLTFLVAE